MESICNYLFQRRAALEYVVPPVETLSSATLSSNCASAYRNLMNYHLPLKRAQLSPSYTFVLPSDIFNWPLTLFLIKYSILTGIGADLNALLMCK